MDTQEKKQGKDPCEQLEEELRLVAEEDVYCLVKAQQSYGDSWKKRGGTGAFMMLARKWDRLENQVKRNNYDVFEAVQLDGGTKVVDGIIDDIRDLRRYLTLVEHHLKTLEA